MADYIKREDVIDRIERHLRQQDELYPLSEEDFYTNWGLDVALDIVGNEPAADVRENVRGEWIGESDGYADGSLVYDMWYCSHCGYRCEDDEPPKWNYCPICGADMRGEKNGTQT